MPEVAVILDGSGVGESDRQGVLAQDVLGAFESYTIDFATMSFEFGAAAQADK